MTIDRNYWATYKHWLILWEGELPPPSKLGMERVFEFTRRVLGVAEREQVMHVIESPTPWSFKLTGSETWFDYVRERFEQKGHVILFPGGGGPTHQTGSRLRIPARLAYFKGADIVEEEVEDPGLLLRSLQAQESYIGRYSTTPIVLRGYSRSGEDRAPGKPPSDKVWISLSLYTDIWFPRVIGLNAEEDIFDGVHPARSRDQLMDNSALAARHTPRLNRFIQHLREAVLDLGGTWSFDRKETDYRYLPMIHDGGIILDYPAASA